MERRIHWISLVITLFLLDYTLTWGQELDSSHSRVSYTAYGVVVSFERPDSTLWIFQEYAYNADKGRYLGGYANFPRPMDSTRKAPIALSFAFERLPAPMTVLDYSAMRRSLNKVQWQVTDISEPPVGSRKNVLYFFGYDSTSQAMRKLFNGPMKIFEAFLVYKTVGIEIVGDANAADFDAMLPAMKRFAESVEFADSGSTEESASSLVDNKQVQFLDIPWGVDGATAKEMMTAREGVRILPDDSDSMKLMFEGGAYLGKPVRLWNLMFDHDRFISGGVTFEPQYMDEVLPLYVECKRELTSEFGLPFAQKEEFDPTENTKARIRQLKEQANEKTPRFQLSWRIPAPERRMPDGILLYIMEGSDVCISYVCSDLYYEASQRRRMAH